MKQTVEKTITFIQFDEPPLDPGLYLVSADQTVNQPGTNEFNADVSFAVGGDRFTIDPTLIASVFPPDLGNADYTGDLPHVALTRRTLPWLRHADPTDPSSPWLAVLTFDTAAPSIQKKTAKDLVPFDRTITVIGSSAIGTGALDANLISHFSAETSTEFDYGESPNEECTVIDVPVAVFNEIAPCVADLPWLAHIRETDTADTEDDASSSAQFAIVQGNRMGANNGSSYAFLVSLQGLATYLPNTDGTQSAAIHTGVDFVRLLTYRNWRFFSNETDVRLQTLLEDLNKNPDGSQGLTTLQIPFEGDAPSPSRVELALADRAVGTLTPDDANVLVQNALTMGYVPMNHALRQAGSTVSWYRGPLAPSPVAATISIPATCADALSQYDPLTGMFDVSYAASWQLGQLLALQNSAFAVALYGWKKSVTKAEAAQAEQQLISQALGPGVLPSFVALRTQRVGVGVPTIPDYVVSWIARLRLLYGIPFQYLVPDLQMLPPESLRFFCLDENWVEALVDGAFSIGRATSVETQSDAKHTESIRAMSVTQSRNVRQNPRPASATSNGSGLITGFLMRSLIVSGYPKLRVEGYADAQGTTQVNILRMNRLPGGVLMCLFDGAVQLITIHESPQQLHCGAESNAHGQVYTTLRQITGLNPGQQYPDNPATGHGEEIIATRADGKTIQAAVAAANIKATIKQEFEPNLDEFTSAEFALEMIKGVIKVEFLLQPQQRGNE